MHHILPDQGRTQKILTGGAVSKRSATISWRGAYKKILGITNLLDGRKSHFRGLPRCVQTIVNLRSHEFTLLKRVTTAVMEKMCLFLVGQF